MLSLCASDLSCMTTHVWRMYCIRRKPCGRHQCPHQPACMLFTFSFMPYYCCDHRRRGTTLRVCTSESTSMSIRRPPCVLPGAKGSACRAWATLSPRCQSFLRKPSAARLPDRFICLCTAGSAVSPQADWCMPSMWHQAQAKEAVCWSFN